MVQDLKPTRHTLHPKFHLLPSLTLIHYWCHESKHQDNNEIVSFQSKTKTSAWLKILNLNIINMDAVLTHTINVGHWCMKNPSIRAFKWG